MGLYFLRSSFFLFLLIEVSTFLTAESASSDEEISGELLLTRRLLDGYAKSARPVRRDSTPVNVTFDIAFNQLVDIDEKAQVMIAVVWLRVGWTDEYLRWNATEVGINEILLSHDDVWMPDLTLLNNANENVALPTDKNLVINSSGYVTWLQPAVTKSQCTINSLVFPFDVQTCPLTFGSWSYHSGQVDFFQKSESGDISEFIPNGVFDLTDFSVVRESRIYQCCVQPFRTLTYYALLRRLSLYFIFNLYLPCVLMSFVSLMVFYLPRESGEKTSLAVTMLLALTVFMLVASEYLPPSSSNIPYIAQYLMGTITLLGMSLAATVVTLHVHHRGDYGAPAPSWLKRLTLTYLARPLCHGEFSSGTRRKKASDRKSRTVDNSSKPNKNIFSHSATTASISSGKVRCISWSEIPYNLEDQNPNSDCQTDSKRDGSNSDVCFNGASNQAEESKSITEESTDAVVVSEWIKIAAVLDRFFLVIFFLLTLALNILTMTRYMSYKYEYEKPTWGASVVE